MDWGLILSTVGSVAAASTAGAWLARALLTQLLAKDLERFKGALMTSSAVQLERTRADLQAVNREREIRFSALHAKRAEALLQLYEFLYDAYTRTSHFAFGLGATQLGVRGRDPEEERRRADDAFKAVGTFYRTFLRTRLLLPSALAEQLDSLMRAVEAPPLKFLITMDNGEKPASYEAVDGILKPWLEQEAKVPEVLRGIEAEFRLLLGVETKEPSTKLAIPDA